MLTPRQMQIFKLISKGLSNQEIAERLGISVRTVKVHNTDLFRRLKISRRSTIIVKGERLLGKKRKS